MADKDNCRIWRFHKKTPDDTDLRGRRRLFLVPKGLAALFRRGRDSMRLFFSAVPLTGAVSVIAQTQDGTPPNPAAATNAPTPNTTVGSQALVPGHRIRRAAPAGTPAHTQS